MVRGAGRVDLGGPVETCMVAYDDDGSASGPVPLLTEADRRDIAWSMVAVALATALFAGLGLLTGGC